MAGLKNQLRLSAPKLAMIIQWCQYAYTFIFNWMKREQDNAKSTICSHAKQDYSAGNSIISIQLHQS